METQDRLRIRTTEKGYREIWDPVRKKWVAYTPEEHVRQLFLRFLSERQGYPAEHIAVEYPFLFENGKKQRADIVVFDRNARPLMVIECKAADVQIDREVFRQATRYNAFIKAPCIVLTNSTKHYCYFTSDLIGYTPADTFPTYESLCLRYSQP